MIVRIGGNYVSRKLETVVRKVVILRISLGGNRTAFDFMENEMLNQIEIMWISEWTHMLFIRNLAQDLAILQFLDFELSFSVQELIDAIKPFKLNVLQTCNLSNMQVYLQWTPWELWVLQKD